MKGPDPLQTVASQYGLGHYSGIALPGEDPGIVPDAQVVAKEHAQYPKDYPDGVWEPGFEVQEAIGEGQDSVTPLQLANAYATFANGGTLYVPQVALAVEAPGSANKPNGKILKLLFPPGEKPRDHTGPTTVSAMLQGFEGVTANPQGTAYPEFQSFPLSQYPVAGKTGTAQVDDFCPLAGTCAPGQVTWPAYKQDTSVFASFAPVSSPRYVVDAVFEQSGYGASVAAPAVEQEYETLFGLNKPAQQGACTPSTGSTTTSSSTTSTTTNRLRPDQQYDEHDGRRQRVLGDNLDNCDLGRNHIGNDDDQPEHRLMALTTAPPPSPSATAAVPRRPCGQPRLAPRGPAIDRGQRRGYGHWRAHGLLDDTGPPRRVRLQPAVLHDKQATYAGIAFAVFLLTILFDYKRYLSWAPVLYVGSILLLLATLAIGRTTLGATSWIQVGSIEVEPSEIVKVTFIISLAALLASRKGHITGRLLILVLALSLPPFLLVYKQDALGSAMVLAVVLVGMLLMAGTKGRHMVVLALLAVIAIGGVTQTGVLKQYQKDRLVTFLEAPSGVASANNANNPYAAGSSTTSTSPRPPLRTAVSRAKGFSRGQQTNLSYVPNQDTDFIFTAMAEQFGFVGSAVLLALFGLVVWRSWRASVVSRDLAGTLICVGVLSMLMFQVFENVGMTMGIMPVAGITLPFMSYGGSSMVVDWVAIGLVVNVGMRRLS